LTFSEVFASWLPNSIRRALPSCVAFGSAISSRYFLCSALLELDSSLTELLEFNVAEELLDLSSLELLESFPALELEESPALLLDSSYEEEDVPFSDDEDSSFEEEDVPFSDDEDISFEDEEVSFEDEDVASEEDEVT
jgi:hypothetical protein